MKLIKKLLSELFRCVVWPCFLMSELLVIILIGLSFVAVSICEKFESYHDGPTPFVWVLKAIDHFWTTGKKGT